MIVSSAVKAALIVACVCIHALLLRVVHRAVFAPLKDSLQGIFLAASFLDDSGHVTSNSTADFDADSGEASCVWVLLKHDGCMQTLTSTPTLMTSTAYLSQFPIASHRLTSTCASCLQWAATRGRSPWRL